MFKVYEIIFFGTFSLIHIDPERMKIRRRKMSRNNFVYVFKIVSLQHFMACKLVHRKYLSIFIDQY